MNKTKLYRKHLSVFLMIVFFIPLMIKATHFLYEHHEYYNISHSNKPELNEKHHKCEVCAYKLIQLIDNKCQPYNVKPEFLSDFLAIYSQSEFIILSFYSFSLRAPPVNVKQFN